MRAEQFDNVMFSQIGSEAPQMRNGFAKAVRTQACSLPEGEGFFSRLPNMTLSKQLPNAFTQILKAIAGSLDWTPICGLSTRNPRAQLQGVDAVYFTLDIDGLDPAYAPGTGTPEAGGLSTRELLEFMRVIFARLPVRALDIVEVAPPLDCAGITTFAAAKVIYKVFGWVKERLSKA